MNKTTLLLLASLTSGCASMMGGAHVSDDRIKSDIAGVIGLTHADERQCEINFKAEGSLFTGKMFQTSAKIKGTKDAVYGKIGANLSKQGLKIENSNKEFGAINGSFKSGVITATITPEGNGMVQVDVQASLKSGVIASDDNYKKEFCDLLDSAAQ